MKRYRRLVITLGFAVIAGVAVLPATASAHTLTGTTTEYRAVNMTDKGTFNGDWLTCVSVASSKVVQHPFCHSDVTITLQVSGGAGYTNGEISGAIGFNVSYSESTGQGTTWDVPAGEAGNGQVGWHYERYTAGMESRVCGIGGCGGWSSPTSVTIQKHLNPAYRFLITN
jgi:hypothetical protein